MSNKVQLEMDFEPGLTQQFPELIDLVAACVYGSRAGVTGCANEIGISVSHLSRILSRKDPEDVRHFSVNWLPVIIRVTNDKRPISWLIEHFMDDPQQQQKKTLDQFAQVAGRMNELLPHVERILNSP